MNLSLPDDNQLPVGAALRPAAIPASKSVTNRALLLAAMAPGRSTLRGGLEAEDTRWMREALRACGIPVLEHGSLWTLEGGAPPRPSKPLFLGASGTSLRFLLPWLALHGAHEVLLEGDPRLFERPLGPLEDVLHGLGARLERRASGLQLQPAPSQPRAWDLTIDASLSSQFVTGLALSAARHPHGARLRWTELASPSYLRLTNLWLHRFGCASVLTEGQWSIPGELRAVDVQLPLDWSGAAAFYAAAAVTGHSLTLGPWDAEDEQGDRALIDILETAGCRVTVRKEASSQWITVEGPLRHGIHADLTLCPDLAPVLAAVAALAPQVSELTGLETLRHKECDRLDASAELVRWLGGSVTIDGDHALGIQPGSPLGERAPFDPRNDHRMAFAAAVGGLRRPGTLADAGCVAKTYPTFWEHWHEVLGC